MNFKNKEEQKKMKRCSKCGIEKDESQFYKNATNKDGFQSNCKDCSKKYNEEHREKLKKYYEENKEELKEKMKKYREENPKNHSIKQRIAQFKYKYGISVAPDYYPDKLVEQDNKCALCSTPQFKLKNSLSLDHDHRKNTLRGLLCKDCNISLGHMERRKINGLWFINALDYLIQYNSFDPQIYKNELVELQKRLWIFVNENYKINQLTGDLVNE